MIPGAASVRRLFGRFSEYLGAQYARQRAKQERDRALQRAIVGVAVSSFWLGQYLAGREVHASLWFAVFLGIVMPALALGYRRFLVRHPEGGIAAQYAFLVLDPVVIVGTLVQDPWNFAFLHPFMMIVLIRNGIRYGIRTMYFALGVTLAVCTLLPTSAFWRTDLESTSAFLLSLAFVPLFFSPLIRRIHAARAIEEERARALATHELAVARSAFLAKVSHELRSPLQGIVSALDVIEMRHARAFAGDEELLSRMRRSSMLLNTQLRDLLTLAKGEAGRLQVHAEPFEACALVESMAEDAHDQAAAKGLKLRVVLPPPPLFAVADGARIDQILTNLVVNSIRYTDTGEVRISMDTVGDPPGRLRFVVADTGPGIPEDVLPTLFEPDRFVTAPARRGEGSGIGLAIVRTLVDHLGGTVAVTSELGKGTTFTVEIPAEFEVPEDAEFVDTDTHGRVLVVDDRSDMLDDLENVIDDLGYELDRAGSAAAAARRLAERSYDAVLLDLDMPLRGAASLVAEVRGGEGPSRAAHFIGIGAAERSHDGERPFDLLLAKPIDRPALRRALLAARRARRPAQAALREGGGRRGRPDAQK